MSYQVLVKAKNDPKEYPNGLRFATEAEANVYGRDLWSRWTGCEKTRTVESTDPVNYRWDAERYCAVPLERAA